jgi:hypothetical protein
MHARAVDQAAGLIRRKRRRTVEAGLLAGLCLVSGAAALLVSLPLAAALGAGALVEAAIALGALNARRELIARLALDPAAYSVPEVERYGTRAARPPERARLAAWLEELLTESQLPYSLYLPDRVALVAHELDSIAGRLLSPACTVAPESAVACRRLLTHAVESPLYNPRVPLDELHLTLRRIRAGMG